MRAIVLLFLLVTSFGQLSIAGLSTKINAENSNASQISFSSSDQDKQGLHFTTYHDGSDLLIIEELFEEDTEESESDKEQSLYSYYGCSGCQQMIILQEAYRLRTYLPSQKYLTFSSVPIWILDEVFRL